MGICLVQVPANDPFVFYDTGKPVGDWQGVVMTGVVDDPSGVAAGHVSTPAIYNGVTTGSKAQQWFACEWTVGALVS